MKLSDLSQRQIDRARVIFNAALPFGTDAVAAALMTAAAESSFWLYANDGTTKRTDVSTRAREVARESLAFEYDRVAPNQPPDTPAGTWDTTADSVGHFQQRPMYGYGTVADLMDPAESTRIFLRGSKGGKTRYFLASPTSLSLPQRCQWTQGSEYPTGENYEPMAVVVGQLINLFGKDWVDMATKDEVKAAFQEATAGIAADASEARRLAGIAAGYKPKDGTPERTVGEQVMLTRIRADESDYEFYFQDVVRDINTRSGATRDVVGDLVESVAALTAKVDALTAAVAKLSPGKA